MAWPYWVSVSGFHGDGSEDGRDTAEDQRGRQHTQLERGNAVRVYRGIDWKRMR